MTVYVTQRHLRRDKSTGEMTPVHDLSPAAQFGDLVVLLGPTAVPYNAPPIIAQLTEQLRAFTPSEDYLLPLGNPVLQCWTFAVTSGLHPGAPIAMLEFNRERGVYRPVRGTLFPDCAGAQDRPV